MADTLVGKGDRKKPRVTAPPAISCHPCYFLTPLKKQG
jgi:hypothetical protein